MLGATGSAAVFGYDGLFIALCAVLSLGVLLLLARPRCASAAATRVGDAFALRAPGPRPGQPSSRREPQSTEPTRSLHLMAAGTRCPAARRPDPHPEALRHAHACSPEDRPEITSSMAYAGRWGLPTALQ
ncbi:hypothetical protein [Streptomyces wuyuanensis]|uniref:hypothetical protein n=1 Tax=Streptomyces wuyuanensis TaxID=1196353 RepID=UPI003D7292A5